MKANKQTRERLVTEACAALGESGLLGLTVASIATRAGVSTALVHYHFDTKNRLLVAATSQLAAARVERRLTALSQKTGMAALDALWDVLALDVRSGDERAYNDLVLHAWREPDIAALLGEHRAALLKGVASRLPGLLAGLGATLPAGADESATALTVLLDGLALSLLAGHDRHSLRTAYDAFWLTVISAGQRAR